jgi:hypothetical protein
VTRLAKPKNQCAEGPRGFPDALPSSQATRDFIPLLNAALLGKDKKTDKQLGLPGLPILGPVKIAMWLWRFALAYSPHCSQ